LKKTYKKKNHSRKIKKYNKNKTKNKRRRSKKYVGGTTSEQESTPDNACKPFTTINESNTIESNEVLQKNIQGLYSLKVYKSGTFPPMHLKPTRHAEKFNNRMYCSECFNFQSILKFKSYRYYFCG
jgi:hypothetical protein